MTNSKLSFTEKLTLTIVFIILLIAFTLYFFRPASLDIYLEEDGIVEWLTVGGLIAGFIVCVNRFIKLFKNKNWWFLTVTFVLALLLFIAAGEEISWGQRIFGIKSSDFFLKNNAQGETNIHNLVVNGVKINKLVFSTMLIAALGIYLVVVPVLYKTSKSLKNFMDRSGVPIARLYQVLCFLISFGISELLPHDRNSELLECAAAALFFLIIYRPVNENVFKASSGYSTTSIS